MNATIIIWKTAMKENVMSKSFKLLVSAVEDILYARHKELISPKYAELRKLTDSPLFGLCYVASEAVFILAKELKLPDEIKPIRGAFLFRGVEISHWALLVNGEVVDLTADQFAGELVLDYEMFRYRTFAPQISERTQNLMKWVKDNPARFNR